MKIGTSVLAWGRGIFASAFVALASPAAADVTPQEMRGYMVAALEAGQPELAEQAAKALLNRDLADAHARLYLARAYLAQGDLALGRAEARRVWREAEDIEVRYAAARVLAVGHAQGDNDLRAQYWLRRAVQLAPDDETRTGAIRSFQAVRRQSPLRVNLSFGLTPMDNINNAPEDAYLDFGALRLDITPPLSGTEAAIGFAAQYRLNTSRRQQTWLDAIVHHRQYRFTTDAQEIAEDWDLTEKDFEYTTAQLGVRHLRAVGPGRLAFGASVTEVAVGGDPDKRVFGLTAEYQRPLTAQLRVSYGVRASHSLSLDGRPDADATDLWLRLTRSGTHGRLVLTGEIERGTSDSYNLDYRGLRADVSYEFHRPVLGTSLSLSAGVSARDFPVASAFELEERRDRSLRLGATFAFDGAEFMGFVPTLSADYRRTSSSVDRFEVESLRIGAGFRSNF